MWYCFVMLGVLIARKKPANQFKGEANLPKNSAWSSRGRPTLIKWMNIRLSSRRDMEGCTIQSSHSLDLFKWFLYSLCHTYWVALLGFLSGRGASALCSLFNTASGLWWYLSKPAWGRKDQYIRWWFALKRGLEASISSSKKEKKIMKIFQIFQ